MSHSSAQLRIPAVYMRGGTSKGVFFHAEHLPHDAAARDKLLLRVTGSPDSYGKQIDGLGGATSSTSKVVVISRSSRTDCDIDYLFGAVAIDAPVVDWTGNCGNLTSAVGPFAISEGLVQAPRDGWATVRIWQANIQKRIIAHVQMRDGEVVETGDFELDGVAFPAAEVRLEFLDPGGEDDEEGGAMFPTGNKLDALDVPGVGRVEATLINAGNPAIFVDAAALGLNGTELQRDINNNADVLRRAEAIRSHAAVAMGLGSSAEEVTRDRPHTPKLAFFSPPSGLHGIQRKASCSHPGRPLGTHILDGRIASRHDRDWRRWHRRRGHDSRHAGEPRARWPVASGHPLRSSIRHIVRRGRSPTNER